MSEEAAKYKTHKLKEKLSNAILGVAGGAVRLRAIAGNNVHYVHISNGEKVIVLVFGLMMWAEKLTAQRYNYT